MASNYSQDFEASLKPVWSKAQAGDEAAYEQALRKISERLRIYLKRRLTLCPDDVEDLLQETLLALHLNRGTYDPEIPVTAWIFAIARHKLVDFWRRHGRREGLHEVFDDDDFSQAGVADESRITKRDLGALLRLLPNRQRQAIELTKIEGLSIKNAALQTGSTESAIKVQVHRGLKGLMKLVKATP